MTQCATCGLVPDGPRRKLLDVPARQVDQVLILGPVQTTTQALYECMQHGIELAYCATDGTLLCQLTPPMPLNLPLRLKQYDAFRDPELRRSAAAAVVRCKLLQCAELLERRLRSNADALLAEQLQRWRGLLEVLPGTEGGLPQLRGQEGSIAREWYALLPRLLRDPLGFDGRSRRPPRDPVNALLSLGYSLVTARLNGLVDGYGLDPHLGFMHSAAYGRPALACDLVEEFRCALVERFVIGLINRRQFRVEHFECGPDGGVWLSKSELKRFLTLWEERLALPAPAWNASTYDAALRSSVEHCAACLRTGKAYWPLPLAQAKSPLCELDDDD